MIRAIFASILDRVRRFWELEDREERIEGSGEVHLDPAYNGRYTAERRLKQLSEAQEQVRDDEQFDPGYRR